VRAPTSDGIVPVFFGADQNGDPRLEQLFASLAPKFKDTNQRQFASRGGDSVLRMQEIIVELLVQIERC
jgi:hypothetical protein